MVIRVINKIFRNLYFKLAGVLNWIITWWRFKLNGVNFKNDFIVNGRPFVNTNLTAKFTIGNNFIVKSGKQYNIIGRQQKCTFIIGPNASLIIGNNVGISNSSICCFKSISIGNNVKIGGGVVIYDTDFHSLTISERTAIPEIMTNVQTKEIVIEDNVFIGAHSTILKGVIIGENAVIGACSVVTKPVPANEVWAGNPAKFIRTIN